MFWMSCVEQEEALVVYRFYGVHSGLKISLFSPDSAYLKIRKENHVESNPVLLYI